MSGGKRPDPRLRAEAARLHDEGHGTTTVATMLGLSRSTVRKWICTYESVGIEGLMGDFNKHGSYGDETRAAAVRAVVDEGATVSEAMAMYGIRSRGTLERWLAEARGGSASGRVAPRRENDLERRVRLLEAENAYLKKSIALKAEKRSRTGRRPQ